MIQVNLFQKPSFLHQLIHNMTRYCSLNSPEKYKFRTCCVQKIVFVFVLTFKTIFVHNMLSTSIFFWNSRNNLLSYCGLTDAKMRTSEKDLNVQKLSMWNPCSTSQRFVTSHIVPYNLVLCLDPN